MGMFDSLYDERGREWQTKALGRGLRAYRIGDAIKAAPIGTCQIEVLGGRWDSNFTDSFATVRDGVLVEVPAERDVALPRVDYYGTVIETPWDAA